MNLFTKIENGFVHLYSKGITKEVPLFVLGDHLYAKYGSGYIRLRGRKGTSVPTVTWEDVHAGDGSYVEDTFNLIYNPPVSARKRKGPSAVAAE